MFCNWFNCGCRFIIKLSVSMFTGRVEDMYDRYPAIIESLFNAASLENENSPDESAYKIWFAFLKIIVA